MREEIIGDCRLYCGDSFELLAEINGYGSVVTDPPYMMGAASTRQGKGYRSRVPDWTNAARWFADWMGACWQALPDTGSMWMCGNWRSLPVITMAGDMFGASTSSVVVWDKDWIGVGSMRGLRQRYELVFQFGKPLFGVENRSEPDIWVVPWASARPNGHESEKPVGLMAKAISFVGPGAVLDPFMGSGTTGVACVAKRLPFIGIELDPQHFATACRRIEQAYRQADLFREPPAPKPEQLVLA